MKKLLMAAALALSTACTPLGGVLQPFPASSATHVVLEGTDALSKAADAYAGAALLAEKVVRQDILHPNQLQMLRGLNNRAISLLSGADTTLTAAQRAASVFLIITQMHSIIGR